MASWIKEKDGIEWYDEAYTTKQTNQSVAQLEKKAKAKKIRRFKQRKGGYWYARPDVEALREAYLKRSKAAKGWKPSDEQLEARHTRQWKRQIEKDKDSKRQSEGSSYGALRQGPLGAHADRVMFFDIEKSNEKRKRED